MAHRRRSFIATFAGLLLLCTSALAYAQAPPAITSADFARSAAEHFMTQLAAAREAQSKSKDPDVKELASRIVAQYEQASSALAELCEQMKIDVTPQRTGQAVAGAVSATPDSAFDNVYTTELSQALAKAETSFTAAMQSPKVDAKLKDFAQQQMNSIREDRKRADPLARKQATQRPAQGNR